MRSAIGRDAIGYASVVMSGSLLEEIDEKTTNHKCTYRAKSDGTGPRRKELQAYTALIAATVLHCRASSPTRVAMQHKCESNDGKRFTGRGKYLRNTADDFIFSSPILKRFLRTVALLRSGTTIALLLSAPFTSTYFSTMKGNAMKTRNIAITDIDRRRLGTLVDRAIHEGYACRDTIDELEHELERATPVAPEECPADLITMNSLVRLRDLDRGEMKTYKLVYPDDANGDQRELSVLSPIGTAIIGCRAGDLVECWTPDFHARLCVEDVLYQPESAGAYDR